MKILFHSNNPFCEMQKKKPLPKLKSSMTIYLMLVLLIIMALIFTLTESGRVSAINARLRSITYMSADSVFAEFAQPLFDRYGVLMLWMDEAEVTEKFNDYVAKNLDLSGTEAGMDLDLYGMRYQGSELTEAKWIVDQNGKAFTDQVYEYMKLHAIEGAAEKILSDSGKFEQSEKARSVIGKLGEFQEGFAEVEETAADIYEKTQRVKDLSENPKTLLEDISRTLTDYENGDTEAANEKFYYQKQQLANSKEELSKELSGIQGKSGEYYEKTASTQEAVQEMKEELALEEAEMDPELYQALMNRISGIENAPGSSSGQPTIPETLQAAEEYQGIMGGLDQYLAGTQDLITEENVGYYRQLTSEYQAQVEGFDLSRLGGTEEAAAPARADTGFIRRVRKKYSTGLLDLIAGSISKKAVNRETFPSVTCKMDSSTEEDVGIVDKTVQKALFCEYIREHFSSFVNVKEDHPLDYEAEYILAGKDNDRDNLNDAITQLVLLRVGANLMSIFMDSTKTAEIQELAIAVIGFTGQVYLVKVAELVITLIWAAAEGIIDARQLLHGKKVPFLKKSTDWYLSIEGLQNFTGDEEGEGYEDGLGYEEYLMVLLLLENRNKQVFRTMDVIQANMCDEETENFRIKDCLVGVRMEAEFTAPSVFVSLPVVRRSFEAGAGGYQFQFTQEYAY